MSRRIWRNRRIVRRSSTTRRSYDARVLAGRRAGAHGGDRRRSRGSGESRMAACSLFAHTARHCERPRSHPAAHRSSPAGADGVARVWELDRTARFARSGTAASSRPRPSARTARSLATAGRDREARVWRLSDGRLLGQLPRPPRRRPHVDRLQPGRRATSSRRVGTPTHASGARRRRARDDFSRGHTAMVSEAVFSPDGRWVATAGPTRSACGSRCTGRRIDAGTPELFLRGHAAGAAVRRVRPSRSRAISRDLQRRRRRHRPHVPLRAVRQRRRSSCGLPSGGSTPSAAR